MPVLFVCFFCCLFVFVFVFVSTLLRYDNENGWKGGIDYGWIADGDGGVGVSLAWAAEFHTDPQGLLVTTVTQDAFSLTAEGGGGNGRRCCF